MVIIEATTTSLLPQLVSERLDAAVVNLPVDHPDVDTRPLFDEDRIVVVPSGHPLTAYDQLTLAELEPHPVLMPPTGTAFRDEIETDARRSVSRSPRWPRSTAYAFDLDGLPGFGPALVPASAAPLTSTVTGSESRSRACHGGPWESDPPPIAALSADRAVIDTLVELVTTSGHTTPTSSRPPSPTRPDPTEPGDAVGSGAMTAVEASSADLELRPATGFVRARSCTRRTPRHRSRRSW